MIDIPGDCSGNVIVAMDESGQARLSTTKDQAVKWAMGNCPWDFKVVEICECTIYIPSVNAKHG